MERITPTGWGQQKGQPIVQLGSIDAVIEAMPNGGVVIVASLAAGMRAEGAIHRAGLNRNAFVIYPAMAGPDELYRIPPETVIGVAPDAFAAVPAAMWEDMQRILTKRFTKIIWG